MRRPVAGLGSPGRPWPSSAGFIILAVVATLVRFPVTASHAAASRAWAVHEATPADPDAGDEDETDHGAHLPWGLTIGAELELAGERQAGTATNEFTFDEVDLDWSGGHLTAEVGLKYDTESGRGLRVEDAALRADGGGRWPLFAELGRMVLPFGQLESDFVEDPLVAVAAETDDASLVIGVTGAWGVLEVGVLEGEHAGAGAIDCVVSSCFEPREGLSLGVSWTRDLGESVELRELRADRREVTVGAASDPSTRPVAGLGLYGFLEGDAWSCRLEFVRALSGFAPGVLHEEEVEPSALNLEAAVRLTPRWQVAARFESSGELPEAPRRQCGLAGIYTASGNVSVTAEALRGFFADEPHRTQVSLMIGLEY